MQYDPKFASTCAPPAQIGKKLGGNKNMKTLSLDRVGLVFSLHFSLFLK